MTDGPLFALASIVSVVLFALGLVDLRAKTLARDEKHDAVPFRAAPSTPIDDRSVRTVRAIAAAFYGLALLAPFSFAWFLHDPAVPSLRAAATTTAEPADLGPNFDFILVLVVAACVLVRAIPALVLALVYRRRARDGAIAPSNHARAAHVALGIAAVLFAVCAVRLALGGVDPSAFVGGLLTPPGAARGRVEWTVRHAIAGGASVPIERGDALPSFVDVRFVPGSDCCGGLAHPPYESRVPRDGVRCFVAGVPTLVELDTSHARWLAHAVVDSRDAEPEALPHFARLDRAVRVRNGRWILVGADASSAPVAVLAYDSGALDPRVSDVALLVQPSWSPAAFLALALALGWLMARTARRRPNVAPALRAFTVWIVTEALVFALVVGAPYL